MSAQADSISLERTRRYLFLAIWIFCHEMMEGSQLGPQLGPSPYCICDTNLTCGCPPHVAPQVSIFFHDYWLFWATCKGHHVFLGFP